MDPGIRLAGPEDAERVAFLASQLGTPRRAQDVSRRLRALAREHDHVVFVAEDDAGLVIGFAHVCVRPNLVMEPTGEVSELVVDEPCRGRGFGRRLMAQAESWARSRGLETVMLRSNVIRTEAHAFYESLGYTLLKTQKCFRRALS